MKIKLAVIGFMASGKTTVSRKISEMTGLRFIDLDEEISRQAGMSINEIFGRHGEEYFRGLETGALFGALKAKEAIISCGGGIVLKDENISAMRNLAKVVYLSVSPETVFKRTANNDVRPLIRGKSLEEIEELMEKRKARYLLAAHMEVSADNKSPEQLSREIIDRLLL